MWIFPFTYKILVWKLDIFSSVHLCWGMNCVGAFYGVYHVIDYVFSLEQCYHSMCVDGGFPK